MARPVSAAEFSVPPEIKKYSDKINAENADALTETIVLYYVLKAWDAGNVVATTIDGSPNAQRIIRFTATGAGGFALIWGLQKGILAGNRFFKSLIPSPEVYKNWKNAERINLTRLAEAQQRVNRELLNGNQQAIEAAQSDLRLAEENLQKSLGIEPISEEAVAAAKQGLEDAKIGLQNAERVSNEEAIREAELALSDAKATYEHMVSKPARIGPYVARASLNTLAGLAIVGVYMTTASTFAEFNFSADLVQKNIDKIRARFQQKLELLTASGDVK